MTSGGPPGGGGGMVPAGASGGKPGGSGITGGQLGCLGLLLVASEPLEGTGGERAVAGS